MKFTASSIDIVKFEQMCNFISRIVLYNDKRKSDRKYGTLGQDLMTNPSLKNLFLKKVS